MRKRERNKSVYVFVVIITLNSVNSRKKENFFCDGTGGVSSSKEAERKKERETS
jgi:hypothetical protein